MGIIPQGFTAKKYAVDRWGSPAKSVEAITVEYFDHNYLHQPCLPATLNR